MSNRCWATYRRTSGASAARAPRSQRPAPGPLRRAFGGSCSGAELSACRSLRGGTRPWSRLPSAVALGPITVPHGQKLVPTPVARRVTGGLSISWSSSRAPKAGVDRPAWMPGAPDDRRQPDVLVALDLQERCEIGWSSTSPDRMFSFHRHELARTASYQLVHDHRADLSYLHDYRAHYPSRPRAQPLPKGRQDHRCRARHRALRRHDRHGQRNYAILA